jgi:hypothetical protein
VPQVLELAGFLAAAVGCVSARSTLINSTLFEAVIDANLLRYTEAKD